MPLEVTPHRLDAPPGEGRPQHSLTAAGAAPIVDASLIGRPEFDDRTRTIGDTRLHDDRCRLQAQLVDHRRQAEGGQRAIEPPGGCGAGGYGNCWVWSPALGRWINLCY